MSQANRSGSWASEPRRRCYTSHCRAQASGYGPPSGFDRTRSSGDTAATASLVHGDPQANDNSCSSRYSRDARFSRRSRGSLAHSRSSPTLSYTHGILNRFNWTNRQTTLDVDNPF